MTEQGSRRRLAAILALDMVGYSRLVGIDEPGTIAKHKQYLVQVIGPGVDRFNGRIVKHMGDGLLAEFSSAVDAVQCAVEVQNEINAREVVTADELRISYRIGLNLGDIVIDGDDIMGDGVNLAARIEPLAEPGGVSLSRKVFEEVQNKTSLTFEDTGEHDLKNIARPVRIFRVLVQGKPEQRQDRIAENAKSAVAVLPFANLSQDPEQQYFSDGLSEDIITLLSAWRSFPVVARNSSFAYRDRSQDIRRIAKELAARYVIEGSVRKSGNRVRVNAQLVDAMTGHHLWAHKYDGALDDIFEIQDEMTWQIVSAVEPHMEQAEFNKAATKRSVNLNAWDYYLRARMALHQLNPNDNAEARKLFEKAIALDPDYSDAYAGLSLTYQRDILYEVAEDRAAFEQLALQTARRAVALDDGSSYAHLALGGAYIWLNEHELSIAETRMAVQLNPSNVQARFALGNRLDIVGSAKEGMPLLESSLQLSPRDPHSHIYFVQLARAYINARKYERARDCLTESIRRKPDHPHTYHMLAICLGHIGDHEQARQAARRCDELHPGFIAKRARWNIYVDPAANAHLTEGLRKAGLVD